MTIPLKANIVSRYHVEPPFVVPAPAETTTPRSAKDEIRRVLTEILPSGVPPFFRRIVGASFNGNGNKQISAELEMFDGGHATVVAWQWLPGAWAHRWVNLEGGDVSWEDGRWWRINAEGARVCS